jgi:hypothetical protein
MSNYADLSFSDEELITLYLFGVIDKYREIKQTYEYANRHLRDWFSKLPSYVTFVQRLNKVAEVFAPLLTLGYQPLSLVFANPLKPCLLGLKKKLASNAPVKFALITVSWYTSLVTRSRSVLLDLFAGLALNSH